MNTTFHPLVKSLMVGLTALSLGGAALVARADEAPAAPATAAGQGDMAKGDHHGKFAERMAKHQAKLHDKLKLTAAQEPAWTAFIASAAPHRPDGARPAHQEFAKLSAPERMEKHLAMSKQRISMQENRLASLKTFYATLTPEQKKVFDENIGGGRHGRWGHHGPREHAMHGDA